MRPSSIFLSAVLLAGVTAAMAQPPAPGTPPTAPGAVAGAVGPRRFGPAVGVPVLGMPFIHDPSTVVHFHGKYYVFGTGPGVSVYSSPDAETWTRENPVFDQIPEAVHAGVPKNDGRGVWAPDIIRVKGQFYLYYAVSSWGSFQSVVALATNPVLDPRDPAYKWTDRGIVVSSNGTEDLNAIDPGVMLAPDGTLWICYGSYHGSIRIKQLDPKTGLPLQRESIGSPVASARESEASDIIFHNGYYYLFVNHGSCCKGKLSEYNIRVGRSRRPDGPYVDKHGISMESGGGSLFMSAHDHRIGPGHFGRVLDYDASPAGDEGGPERFSIHYEADLTRNGRSVLDIRPLLWSLDDWPVPGDNLTDATYQIVSRQSEYTLEEHMPQPAVAPDAGKAVTGQPPTAPPAPPSSAGAPVGVAHLARYITLDSQKWKIAPAHGGYYSVVNAGTGDALGFSQSAGVELTPYASRDSQMWRLDQFPDGGYRIVNKATGKCLMESGATGLAAGPFVRDDSHLWTITTP